MTTSKDAHSHIKRDQDHGHAAKVRTIRNLIFNDPIRGETYEIPAGEVCIMFNSVKSAMAYGHLPTEDLKWEAQTNLSHGYALVLIRGQIRGVPFDAIKKI